jgi:ribosomal protein L11 methyltransferase
MKEYIQIKFQDLDTNQQEILIALLSHEGYEGFEQSDQILTAFIDQPSFSQTNLDRICKEQEIEYSASVIPTTNWNQSWESSFSPVIIENFAGIRAEFHQPIKDVQYEIIITPKMSFGTGHHATTYMMIQEMSKLDFKDQEVLDFGTGTGVLAILAKKMEASRVVAVDYDDWSIENAAENTRSNDCENIELIKSDHANVPGSYGIILANINKSIIIENMPVFAGKLKKGGFLVVSGLLEEDREDIAGKAAECGFSLVSSNARNNWKLMKFTH